MINKQKTVGLTEFAKNFTPEQKTIAEEQARDYYLLTSFKEAREKQGITQEQLAQKASINRTTLSQIESGLRNATIDTLGKLATAMGMKLEIKLTSSHSSHKLALQ